MAGRAKPSPIEAFELNIADAEWLLTTALALQNQAVRRLRTEMRTKIGESLGLPDRDHDKLDAIRSNDLYVVIKPNSAVDRAHFANLAPLYRQAVVASAAALETYVADAVLARVGPVLRGKGVLPKRLRELTLDVGDWVEINTYERPRRGLREVVLTERIREMSSTAPNHVGALVSMVGLDNWAKLVDSKRGVAKETTVKELTELCNRRNRIAHSGDRLGYGRAKLTHDEASRMVAIARDVVEALDKVLPTAKEA